MCLRAHCFQSKRMPKANGIESYRYLFWLFKNLPLANTADDYAALLPWKLPSNSR